MSDISADVKITEIDGRNVSYIDKGSGPFVLLLHGWNAPAKTYALIINHLSCRCRVVAPDFPGVGDSEEPSKPWGVDDYVDFVVKFAKAMNIKNAVLIGHSHGARIIIKMMSLEKRPFAVSKIILMGAAGIKPKRGPSYYAKVYSYKLAKKLLPKTAEKMKSKTGSPDYKEASPVMRQTLVRVINEDLTNLLKNIDVPTLLIFGELDTATPMSHARIMEREIPGSGLVEIKGAGHFAFADAWGQFSRVMDVFI